MSAGKLFEYSKDLHRDAMRLGRVRTMLGLSRRDFKTHAKEYTRDGERALEPLSVLRIAQAAYHVGTSKNFFPSLEIVGQEVVAHVRQHAPELEAGTQVQVNEFLAQASEPQANAPTIAEHVTLPQALDPLEQTYFDISLGL
jgi:hypothetical protein